MEGKHVVVIGGGSCRMKNFWQDAESYGIKVRALTSVHQFVYKITGCMITPKL
jgi:hypothetical protein